MSTAPLDESRRPRKSRIVIDVEKIQQEQRGPQQRRPAGGGGRARRVLLIAALAVAGLLVVLAVGGLLWWQSFRKTPEYSLALLVDASRRDDVREVERLIDSDQIAAGFVPQVTEKLTGGAALSESARRQIDAATQTLLPRVRETMRDEVKEAIKTVAEKSGDVAFPLLALGVRRASEVAEEGDAAVVKVARGERPVELTMKRDGERWKLTGFKDDELASKIAERIRASIPPAGQTPTQGAPRRRPNR